MSSELSTVTKTKPTRVEHPDEYRMTLGEHLEELRSRLILGLLGFIVAFAVALYFVKGYLLPFMCRPLLDALRDADLNPQLYSPDPSDGFGIYLRISCIAAFLAAGPWLIYQVWLFVAAGLYPHERKVVTKFIPFSVGLFVAGVAFAFYVIMPMTLQFFISFTASIPVPPDYAPVSTTQPITVLQIPSFAGDPDKPADNQIWINTVQQRIKLFTHGHVRVLPFQSENLVGQMFTFNTYIDLLLTTLVIFGVCFQLPLVVMAIVKAGIMELQDLKNMRRVVYFILAIMAALITPGDVILSTILLLLPLMGLYELGLLVARPPAKA